MALPLVSVIIPSYNHGQYLREVVESVEKAGYPNTEIIILDDGSTEPSSLEEARKFQQAGYQVIFQENRGVAATRNHGIRFAKGKYVIPLDADNRVLAPYFFKGVEILENNPDCGVVFGDAIVFGQKQAIWPNSPVRLDQILFENFIDNCTIIRKSAWEKVGGYDEKAPFNTWEDWYLWLDFLDAGYSFIHLPEFCFEYRYLENSKVRTAFADRLHRLEIYQYIFPKQKRLIEKFSATGDLPKDKARKMLSDLYGQLAYYQLGYGNISAGILSIFRAWRMGHPIQKIIKTGLGWPIRRFFH